MIDVTGRVMMVSGANRGIGAALARAFHRDGWRVSLGARDLDALRSSVDDLDPATVSCHHYDARDPDTTSSWVTAGFMKIRRKQLIPWTGW